MTGRRVSLFITISFTLLLPLLAIYPLNLSAFERQFDVNEQTLYLNGQGPRKKAFLTVYDIALYLTEKGSDARAIIAADHPMALKLVMRSRFASAERISQAFREGLEKSTAGRIEPIAVQSRAFLGVFEAGVEREDTFAFEYLPPEGVRVHKNGEIQVVIPGLEFKQALFGIWLSEAPVSNKLKAQLLGNK